MDPIIVLRKERDRISKEMLRLKLEADRLEKAIAVLSDHAGANGDGTGNLFNEGGDGPPFDIKRYGEWRKIVKYILTDANRFISWRQVIERVKLLGLEIQDANMEQSVRNALYGLKAKKEAFIYKMPVPPYQQVWGWFEFYDTIAKEAKPGHEPAV